MADDRKQIILKEIQYWKEHHLLPAKYCDFLMNLYTNGEGYEKVTKENGSRFHLPSLSHLFPTILLVLMLPFSFLVIYFTKFPDVLQLGILFLFITYCLWCFFNFKQSRQAYYHLALIVLLFLFLFSTIIISNSLFGKTLVEETIILNFLIWIIIGFRNKWKYLGFTGILGIIFTLIYNVL